MTEREVFPNAPLQLVVFEARHAGGLKVGREALEALVAVFGIAARVNFGGPALRLADEAAGPEAALFQIIDSSATLSVTVWPTSLVVESTEYLHFERFRATVVEVFASFVEIVRPVAFSRVGLRYVDEVHPDPPALLPRDWGRWIDRRLVDFSAVTSRPGTGFGGGLSIDLGDDYMLSFRFTPVPGPAVESAGTLQLRPRPRTPAVILDTDGFWQPEEAEPLAAQGLERLLTRLHDGIRELFDSVVTDASRSLFRSKEMARQ